MQILIWHISCEAARALKASWKSVSREAFNSQLMDKPAPSDVQNTCPVSSDTAVGTSEARLVVASPHRTGCDPTAGTQHHRILLATGSRDAELAVSSIIRALNARVVQVKDAHELGRALRERGAFDLVLSDSHLSGGTGLGILALARQNGRMPPFIIVQSVHQSLVRVAIGGGARGVLATRVVNDVALIELAEDLLGLHDAPASSRRPFRLELTNAIG